MPRKKRSLEQAQLAKEVGLRILALRGDLGLSREEFVHRLGHGSQRVLSNYESGEVLVPTDLAKRICEEFDITFSWLMSGTGPRRQTERRLQVESRRSEEEAFQTLKLIQDLVEKHGVEETIAEENSLKGQFKQALRLCVTRLDNRFQAKKGVRQFGEFLEDFILTVLNLWGPAGEIPKDILISQSIKLRKFEEARHNKTLRQIERLYPPKKDAKKSGSAL